MEIVHIKTGKDYMNKRKAHGNKKVILVTATVFVWMVFYFLVLWRLVFAYQVNKIKLPEGCKHITATVSWTDTFWSHFIAWRLIETDNNTEEEIWDEIQKKNRNLEGRFGGFDVSDEPVMLYNLNKMGEWPDFWYIPMSRISYRVRFDESKSYYVLLYFSETDQNSVMIYCIAGIVSTVLAGLVSGFLIYRSFRGKR